MIRDNDDDTATIRRLAAKAASAALLTRLHIEHPRPCLFKAHTLNLPPPEDQLLLYIVGVLEHA